MSLSVTWKSFRQSLVLSWRGHVATLRVKDDKQREHEKKNVLFSQSWKKTKRKIKNLEGATKRLDPWGIYFLWITEGLEVFISSIGSFSIGRPEKLYCDLFNQ
jgi:hypothetical protein